MEEHQHSVRQKVADSNEPVAIVDKLLEVGWERKPLYSGDYKFFANDFKKIGITRKSISDLLGSLSGRQPTKLSRKGVSFSEHLDDMVDFYDIKIILLEGSWSTVTPSYKILSSRGVEYHTWSMVWNFLRTWQDKGFTLEFTVNEGHTIQRLNELYAYYQKPEHLGGLRHSTMGDDRILAFPSTCRGLTARKVLSHYGSLKKVADATIKELTEIEGIGSKKAERIRIHFNRLTYPNITRGKEK